MVSEKINSNNEKFSIHVGIKCSGKKNLRVCVKDEGKVNSNYVDRSIVVNDTRKIFFNFPISPIKTPLRDFNIWLDSDTQDFLSLSIPFAQVCGFETATGNGRLFTTNDKKYQIKYFDIIRDYKTGRTLNTPARIGHSTGRIEIAKIKFDKYTIPMRMAILLHEYSHVFRNPKIGLEINNEVGADINALYIYLGLGFSKIDAICVYANVFLKAQTKGNIERMRKIMDYIAKFENGDFAYRN